MCFFLVCICLHDGGCDPPGTWGDKAGDPPYPDPFRRGTHETDAVPPRKFKGKVKNRKLRRMVKGGWGFSYIR
ncbi:hypothetical protein Hanom_Chr03g00194381 [Helianthus anomalus]